MEHNFFGKHIIVEMYEINNKKFCDSDKIINIVEHSINKSGATLIKTLFYSFDNGGFTLVSLLKESHVSIHTYPEHQAIFMDVFTCGNIDGLVIYEYIKHYFEPKYVEIKQLIRGITENDF